MGLFSKSNASSSEARAGSGAASDADIVREARTSARRRLIGAALLLGIGIIGFPLLFETQPRPIPVDIRIDIPSKEGAAPLTAPASRVAELQGSPAPAQRPVDTPPSASGVVEREVVEPALPPTVRAPATPPAATTPASAFAAASKPAEPRPVPKPVDKPAEKVAAKPAEKPADKPAEKPADKPADKAVAAASSATPTTADDGRFVVQIGAFAEVDSAREARMKVERMGLKTYTQVIESPSGRRIRVRVGPYPNKAEAEKAANKIKSGGLQAAILLL